jgi:hypothetical protein
VYYDAAPTGIRKESIVQRTSSSNIEGARPSERTALLVEAIHLVAVHARAARVFFPSAIVPPRHARCQLAGRQPVVRLVVRAAGIARCFRGAAPRYAGLVVEGAAARRCCSVCGRDELARFNAEERRLPLQELVHDLRRVDEVQGAFWGVVRVHGERPNRSCINTRGRRESEETEEGKQRVQGDHHDYDGAVGFDFEFFGPRCGPIEITGWETVWRNF